MELVTCGVAFLFAEAMKIAGGHAALASLFHAVAESNADQSLKGMLQALQGRLSTAELDPNHDLQKALLRAYWVAALQVVNDHGARVGVPVSKQDLLCIESRVPQVGEWLREMVDAVSHLGTTSNSAHGVLSQADHEPIHKIYRALIDRFETVDQQVQIPGASRIDGLHGRLDDLLRSGGPDEALKAILTERIVGDVRALVAEAAPASTTLHQELEQLLRERWSSSFVGAFHVSIKSNEAVKSMVFTELLADIRADLRDRKNYGLTDKRLRVLWIADRLRF